MTQLSETLMEIEPPAKSTLSDRTNIHDAFKRDRSMHTGQIDEQQRKRGAPKRKRALMPKKAKPEESKPKESKPKAFKVGLPKRISEAAESYVCDPDAYNSYATLSVCGCHCAHEIKDPVVFANAFLVTPAEPLEGYAEMMLENDIGLLETIEGERFEQEISFSFPGAWRRACDANPKGPVIGT